MDPKTKYKLFKQNKYFCTAPWNLLYVHVDGSIQSCTVGSNFGSATAQNIESVLTNPKFSKLKKNILEDKITDNCMSCIKSENTTGAGEFNSLRNYYNELCVDSDTNYTDISQHKLHMVDLHWSSICDLKCVTCWAVQSSSIAREQNQPVNHTPPDVANKIIEYIVSNQEQVNEIYMSGGEPTLIKYNLKLLKQIKKRDNLILRVNSNMQWQQDNAILKEMLKFPNVLFTCSVDGMNEKFDYIRRGGSWTKALSNIKFLQKQSNVKIRANTVFFVLTAQEIPTIIDYFMEEIGSMDHTINQCAMGQSHLRCRNLPTLIKDKVKQQINDSFIKYKKNLNIAGNLKNCLSELDHDGDSSDYKKYFDNIDKIQGSNWRQLFPELT